MNLRNVWSSCLLLLGCCGIPVAYADDDVLLGLNDQLAVLADLESAVAAQQEAQTPKYWLGLLCIDVGEPLRAQLGLEEGAGLLIDAVTDGTPAKQVGLQRHDVLIVAQPASQPLGDQVKQLKSPSDLVEAVQAAETKPLRLVLFRHGQRKEIEVAPVERNKSDAVKVEIKLTADQGLVDTHHHDLQMFLAGPVFALQSNAPTLPEGMTIEFRQVVGQPEKILVIKGDEKWDVTEPDLGKLPEPVRLEVLRQIVGRRSGPVPFVLTNPPALPGAPVAPVLPRATTTKAYVNEYNIAKSFPRGVHVTAEPATAGNTAITFTTNLPDNVTVTVERKGSEPVKATVKKGEQTWVLGEKGLDQLPEDVRKVVAPVWGHSMAIAGASHWGPRKVVVAEESVKAREAAIVAKKKAETAAEWISKAEVQRIEAMHRAVDTQRKMKEDDIATLRETMDRARREMREEREALRLQKDELSRQTKELHESIDKLRQRLDKAERADKAERD